MANYRNRKLLDLCRDQACYLGFDGCGGFNTVPAHSNLLRHGRGYSFKSHDIFAFPACQPCHYQLDHGTKLSKEEKENAQTRAVEQWILQLFLKEHVGLI